MDMQITFHQMPPSEAIKNYCHSKFDKLVKYYQKIEGFKVVLETIKLEQQVTVVLHLPQKKTIKATVAKKDMYAAIDAMTDKLERQLTDYKERHTI